MMPVEEVQLFLAVNRRHLHPPPLTLLKKQEKMHAMQCHEINPAAPWICSAREKHPSGEYLAAVKFHTDCIQFHNCRNCCFQSGTNEKSTGADCVEIQIV